MFRLLQKLTLLFFILTAYEVDRRSTNNEDLLFVFPEHQRVRDSMYGDLCIRYSSLIRILKSRGENVIFELELQAPKF